MFVIVFRFAGMYLLYHDSDCASIGLIIFPAQFFEGLFSPEFAGPSKYRIQSRLINIIMYK